MKKLILIILTLLYIGSNTGAVLHVHYCMGKLSGWDWGYVNKSNTCSKCEMDKQNQKKNTCCKDEEKIFQDNIDQKTAESVYQLIPSAFFALPILVFDTPTFNFPSLVAEKQISCALISVDGVAVYIRDCVFLI